MNEKIFYRYSKQCWIDLILQLIKVFVLYKTVNVIGFIKEPDLNGSSKSLSQTSEISAEEDDFGNVFNIDFYGSHEKTLREWLEQHFDLERETLWSKPLAKRTIGFFYEELKDGLILGAVTANYCPYVKDIIKTMYIDPSTPEEYFHNACTLVKTWKTLNFSYEVSPFAFKSSTLIETILLVLYLYSVLPGYLPIDTITIEASLTETSKTFIDLANLENETACYTSIFFGNETNFFEVVSERFVLKPKKTKVIEIRYFAKFVHTANSTLLFSGETANFKYSKTVVVNLVGTADVSFAYKEFFYNVKLYKLCEVPITIEAPFKTKASYEILFGHQPADQQNKNVLYSLDEIKNIKTVKTFILKDLVCEFNESGVCSTKMVLCCMQQNTQNFWLYFCNPNVGDFAIKIVINGTITKECFENIEVWLPTEEKRCKCQNRKSISTHCTALIEVKIPSTNKLLWDARKTMLLQCATGAELKFWTSRICKYYFVKKSFWYRKTLEILKSKIF